MPGLITVLGLLKMKVETAGIIVTTALDIRLQCKSVILRYTQLLFLHAHSTHMYSSILHSCIWRVGTDAYLLMLVCVYYF